MATLTNPLESSVSDEKPHRPPPLLAVGPLAWARKNLFNSWWDTLLTILGSLFIVTVLSSFIQWAVSGANWFAIIFNLRQFLIGRYPQENEWRVQLFALLVAAAFGLSLAAWARVSRGGVILLAVVLTLLFSVPAVINALIPLPPAYVAAGNIDIAYGSTSQKPLPRLAFIAAAGEKLTITLAQSFSASDESLARLFSFSDNSVNALRNAAANRLAAEARLAELDTLLAGDLLTASQRERLTDERAALEIPPPVTGTYSVNQNPVTVRVLRGTTQDLVAQTTFTPDSPPLVLELPESGWYILEKIIAAETSGAAVLQVSGLYPLLERSFTRGQVTDDSGTVTAQAGRVNQYVRMTDQLLVEETRPRSDGVDIPFAVIIENQYRGERPLADYLRVYLAPFLNQINFPFLVLVLAGVAGHVGGQVADRFLSPKGKPRRASRRAAVWTLSALPVMMFVLILGVGSLLPVTDTRLWGGLMLSLMLTVVGIIGSFPIGILLALGRRSSLPIVRYACILYIELVRGVPLITVLFMSLLLLPLINPSLAGPDTGVYRAMIAVVLFSAAYLAENVRGGLQSIPHGQQEAGKALGLAGWQVMLNVTLPQALRAVIPALVGQCISLFKDTSLVAIVGLIDLTGIANSVVAQTEFINLRREAFVFISVMYFVVSYGMAAISRRIEASGAGSAQARKI